jgi:flagellar protein FliS
MAYAGTPQAQDAQNKQAVFAPASSVSSSPEKPNILQRGAMLQYQRQQIETAAPTRLIVMLYDGAIRFCTLGQEAMRRRDLEAQNTNLIKAQRILGELLSSLNHEAGGEIASNLSRIYTYLLAEMVKANLYDRVDVIDHILSVLREMRATWEEIDSLTTQESKSEIAESKSNSIPTEMPLRSEPPASTQQRLMAKTARLLAMQQSAGAEASASRLGDRHA